MLTNAKTIRDYKVNGVDGEVGGIKDFFFDDHFWTVRYLVVNTGSWLKKRQVLISPYFLGTVDHSLEFINVDLTKEEIKNSPPLESDMPVSRQYEEQYYGHFGAPVYWGGSSMWGSSQSIIRDREKWDTIESGEGSWDPNLQSGKDVTGLNIQTINDEIGEVDDFIIDDDTWAIRYLVIDTGKWLPGKKVLVSPQWIDRISWDDSKVFVDISREAIENSPEYHDGELLTRDYETRLHKHYNKMGYWSEEFAGSEYSERYHRR